MNWKRYFDIYIALWKNSVVREMSFKTNFIMWIIVEFLWFCLQLTFIHVIYMHTDSIASWSKWQVVLLFGTSHFIQQLFTALFFNNCIQLSELIRTGRLDFLILLPINTRFLISFRQVDLGGFVNAAFALAVIGYSLNQLQMTPTFMQVVGFLFLCATGAMLHYSLMFFLACISFWTVRAQGIAWGYYNLFNIARLPDEAFRGVFKAVFTFALPMLLVSNVPARLLADKLSSAGPMLLLLAMSFLCLLISDLFWRFSVKRYTSASS